MSRLAIAVAVLMIALSFVAPASAQDLFFRSTNLSSTGFGNTGLTAASSKTGYLNTVLNESRNIQANSLPFFSSVDTAIGDFNRDGTNDIATASADDADNNGVAESGSLVIFLGTGDGTFQIPRLFKTVGVPVAIAAIDIENDQFFDVAVAERGFVEVFTGFFITTGNKTFRDRFGLSADPSMDALKTSVMDVVSIQFGNFDNDPVVDIAVLERNGTGMVEVYLTRSNFGGYPASGNASLSFATMGTVGVFGAEIVKAVRALETGISSFPDPSSGGVDQDTDIFVATSKGVEVFENSAGVFTAVGTVVGSGIGPVAVLLADINGGGQDIILLNRISQTVSVFTASGNPSSPYNTEIKSDAPGAPLTMEFFRFNQDGNADLAIVNTAFSGAPSGSISVLTSNGNGIFQLVSDFRASQGLPLFNPASLAVGLLDGASSTDDLAISVPRTGLSPGGALFLSSSVSYQPKFPQILTTTSLLADLTGTGNLNDLVVIEQNLGIVFVLLELSATSPPIVTTVNVGDVFTDPTIMPTSATVFRDPSSGLNNIAITDVGGSPTSGFGQILVATNNGSGFGDPTMLRQFVASRGATNLMTGDFNQDGIDDLAYIDYLSNFAAVLINDGQNGFSSIKSRETGGFQPVAATAADVNDDDILDIVVVNRGLGAEANQSIVSVLIGRGDGNLQPTNSLLQVPSSAIAITGSSTFDSIQNRRIVDFNNDGLPDFAVVSTRGDSSIPSLTLLINRIDSPGSFNVQPPIPLIDGTNNSGLALQLEDRFGGPAVFSGRNGPNGFTAGVGGGNRIVDVADFNADGALDIVVAGAFVSGNDPKNLPFRAAIYLLGNETANRVRVVRPLRSREYGGSDPRVAGADSFMAAHAGELSSTQNLLPDTVFISFNGTIWLDSNFTPILNHAPQIFIRREDLNAPVGQGRKYIVTAGESALIPVGGSDIDNDSLSYKLVASPTGQQAPSFVTLTDNMDNTATVVINGADVNRGPSNAVFTIGVEVQDKARSGPGSRQPLATRAFFTLVVKPNSPPIIAPINDRTVVETTTTEIELKVMDREKDTVTLELFCDRDGVVSLDKTRLTIAPQIGDAGRFACAITATDQFGLASTEDFAINVVAGTAPTISQIPDQTVRKGEVRTIDVVAASVERPDGLMLSLDQAPDYVTLEEGNNGRGVIRIAPTLNDVDSGMVTVTATDSANLSTSTSFKVNLAEGLRITAATYSLNRLFINGFGFGSDGARVVVNGQDVSSSIVGQSDNSITIKGSRRKLNLVNGPNRLQVLVGDAPSNEFVLNLFQ
ncbi:MAG: VCBS repeat-containing protein [Blastocatellia bacterium]|nr:VCBS repeat-containing protein [Blastocatellia bacterium]